MKWIVVGAIALVLGALFAIWPISASLSAAASAAAQPSCPRHVFDERLLAAKNRNVASSQLTVPGEPQGVLLCRYRGINHGGRSLTLARRRRVGDRTTTLQLAARMNYQLSAAEPVEHGTFTSGCFLDNGARVYAYFRYSDEPFVLVEVRLHGCFTVENGRAPSGVLTSFLGRMISVLLPLPR